MKSGLLMSRPSARKATVTPLPVAICCAEGVALLLNAVWVTCRASGSSSGLAGLLGQTLLAAGGARQRERLRARACRRRGASRWCRRASSAICRSGSTEATAGSAARSATPAGEIVTAKAFATCSCLISVPPSAFALAMRAAWSASVACTRAAIVLLPARQVVVLVFQQDDDMLRAGRSAAVAVVAVGAGDAAVAAVDR